MKITNRKLVIDEINSANDLSDFIFKTKILPNFKKIPDDKIIEINTALINIKSVGVKKIKSAIIKLLGGFKSSYQENYWIALGYSKEEAVLEIRKKQQSNSNQLKIKKLNNPNKYASYLPTQLDYWINKGYNLEQAKNKLKERQQTFSLDKCISLLGENAGKERWLNRQQKWQKSISKAIIADPTINARKDSNSIQIIKTTFGDNWREEALKRYSHTNENRAIIRLILYNDFSYNDFLDYVSYDVDFVNLNELIFICSSKILQDNFNKTEIEIRNDIMRHLGAIKYAMGYHIIYNGRIYKSVKEYKIAVFLNESHIQFEYDKPYPFTDIDTKYRYRCDFYLPKDKCYIEYFGLLDYKMPNSQDIIRKYNDKKNRKEFLCKDHNLNYFFSSNSREIIKFLKENYIDKTN